MDSIDNLQLSYDIIHITAPVTGGLLNNTFSVPVSAWFGGQSIMTNSYIGSFASFDTLHNSFDIFTNTTNPHHFDVDNPYLTQLEFYKKKCEELEIKLDQMRIAAGKKKVVVEEESEDNERLTSIFRPRRKIVC